MKKICCVNDMPGVGKIALSAMIPILSARGIDVASLPTALVSNTLDFGRFDILDTTEYMEKTVDIWQALGFRFDCIATGFMVSPSEEVRYSYGEGIFNDITSNKHLVLSAELKTSVNAIIDKLVVLPIID